MRCKCYYEHNSLKCPECGREGIDLGEQVVVDAEISRHPLELLKALHDFQMLHLGIVKIIGSVYGVDAVKLCSDAGITYQIVDFQTSHKTPYDCMIEVREDEDT